jgi:hypothetical protein
MRMKLFLLEDKNMIIEILAAKADADVLIFGAICLIGAAILKYKRLQKIGTVFNPKDPDEYNKKNKSN